MDLKPRAIQGAAIGALLLIIVVSTAAMTISIGTTVGILAILLWILGVVTQGTAAALTLWGLGVGAIIGVAIGGIHVIGVIIQESSM